VAIKTLPQALADPDRTARFEREAKTLAALNQPHIAQIYGLEESNGFRALVMKLVDKAHSRGSDSATPYFTRRRVTDREVTDISLVFATSGPRRL